MINIVKRLVVDVDGTVSNVPDVNNKIEMASDLFILEADAEARLFEEECGEYLIYPSITPPRKGTMLTKAVLRTNDKRIAEEHYLVRKSDVNNPVHLPIVGLMVLEDVIRNYLRSFAAYPAGNILSRREIMAMYLQTEWLDRLVDTSSPEIIDQQEMAFREMLRPFDFILRELDVFLGADPWIMHSVSREGRTFKIVRSIDYRIHDWMKTREANNK